MVGLAAQSRTGWRAAGRQLADGWQQLVGNWRAVDYNVGEMIVATDTQQGASRWRFIPPFRNAQASQGRTWQSLAHLLICPCFAVPVWIIGTYYGTTYPRRYVDPMSAGTVQRLARRLFVCMRRAEAC